MPMQKKVNWWLLIIILLAVALRLPLLGGSFWLDEAAQALESARPLSEQLDIAGDFQPPLLHLIVHFALYFGQSEWWLRTVAALIPSIFTIFFTYQLAKALKLQSPWLAPLLLATSSFHIFYSQELRPYSLPTLWAVLSWLLLIKHKSLKIWVVISLFGLYSSYLYPFLLVTQLVFLMITKWSKKAKLKSLLKTLGWPAMIILLGFLPWLSKLYAQFQASQLVQLSLPGWKNVVGVSQFKVLALTWGKFIFGVLDIEPNLWFVLSSFLILLPLIYLLLNAIKPKIQSKSSLEQTLFLLLTWTVLPLLLAWLVSFFIPILQPKRVLYLLPGFYLLINYLISKSLQPRKLSHVIACGILAVSLLFINLFSTYHYWQNPKLQREDWRGLIKELLVKYPDITQTKVIFAYQAPFSPWEWYDPKFEAVSLGSLSINAVLNPVDLLQSVFTTHRVITFDYLTDLSDPKRQVLAIINQHGYKQTDLLDYSLIGFIRVYEK